MAKENVNKPVDEMDKPLPLWVMIILPIYGGVLLALITFPIAKDWRWLEGWAFVITFVINIAASYFYINKKNPRVIRNRMKLKKEGLTSITKKSAGSDNFILPFLSVGFFGALILPAFDHRYGWSSIPFMVEMIALVLTNIGMIIMDIAMLQNAFASKLLDIKKGQELIDTGLYAHVRHPLYSGSGFPPRFSSAQSGRGSHPYWRSLVSSSAPRWKTALSMRNCPDI
jgi:protein-S-isoprenylcysteine O-methyltransferase Ste14